MMYVAFHNTEASVFSFSLTKLTVFRLRNSKIIMRMKTTHSTTRVWRQDRPNSKDQSCYSDATLQSITWLYTFPEGLSSIDWYLEVSM